MKTARPFRALAVRHTHVSFPDSGTRCARNCSFDLRTRDAEEKFGTCRGLNYRGGEKADWGITDAIGAPGAGCSGTRSMLICAGYS